MLTYAVSVPGSLCVFLTPLLTLNSWSLGPDSTYGAPLWAGVVVRIDFYIYPNTEQSELPFG